MDKSEFYQLYLPALIKALKHENDWDQYDVKGPEFFLNVPNNKLIEIEQYLDQAAGQDDFLDSVAYYFDAKSHGFKKIEGIEIESYKKNIENNILKIIKEKE